MGLRSIHGQTVSLVSGANTGDFALPYPSVWGPAHNITYFIHGFGWPNTIQGSYVEMSFVIVTGGTTSPTGGQMFTRGNGLNPTGIQVNGGAKWASSWNDDSSTWGFSGGPVPTAGPEVLVVVSRATSVQFWQNGTLAGTNSSVSLSPLNFSLLSGPVAWGTGDVTGNGTPQGSRALYAVYARALSGGEVAQLTTDPFCWMTA